MTRTYAVQRLLQHGALSRRDLIAVTGWPDRRVDKAIFAGTAAGLLERFSEHGRHVPLYRLPASHFLPSLA